MKFMSLFRKQREALAIAGPCIRLTAATLPVRRFDEARAETRSSVPAKAQRRYYSAGSTAEFLSWNTPNVSADTALYLHMNVIKGRCRDLARNNDYCREFLRLLESNVVGPNGFTLQGRRYAGEKKDKAFNAALEAHWKSAGKLKNAPTTCRTMTKRELAALWVRTLATDGEVLELLHPAHGNRYRFASQIIDSSLLDASLNKMLPNGNRIKMGVEVDRYGAHVAYWVLNRHPNDIVFPVGNEPLHTRYTSDRARLSFLQEFPGQTRSVSWFASPAIRAQMLQKFEEAVVVTSRAAASKGGFYTLDKDADGVIGPGEEGDADGDPQASDFVRETVEPGQWLMLPRGVTPHEYDPKFPPANLGEMTKVMVRALAAGAGGSYHSISQNLEGVNYSSIRAGDLEQRGIWRALQQFVIDHHEEPYFCAWALILRLNKETPIDGRKLDACLAGDEYKFLGRGWEWVDPQKEVLAHKEALALGLTTRGRIIAERTGEDAEEVFDDLAAENAMLIERGIEHRIGAVVQVSDKGDKEQPAADAPANADDAEEEEEE